MNVLDWLLEGDPAIRWQVMRDLTNAPAEEVAVERARVEHDGWGARLLALEDPDGLWAGGACFPASYRAVSQASRDGGRRIRCRPCNSSGSIRRRSPPAERSCLSRRTGAGSTPAAVLDGESSRASTAGRSRPGRNFGVPVESIVERLLAERLDDGGWNCEVETDCTVPFDTTINVLDGLLEFERTTGGSSGGRTAHAAARSTCSSAACSAARAPGRSSGGRISSSRFRTTGTTTVARARLLPEVGANPDPRMAEAVEVVRSKRQADGGWLLDRIDPGQVYFDLEGAVGTPSRWNTLRALRVLEWWNGIG